MRLGVVVPHGWVGECDGWDPHAEGAATASAAAGAEEQRRGGSAGEELRQDRAEHVGADIVGLALDDWCRPVGNAATIVWAVSTIQSKLAPPVKTSVGTVTLATRSVGML